MKSSLLTDSAFRVHTYRNSRMYSRGSEPVICPERAPEFWLQVFLLTTAICFCLKVSTQKEVECIIPAFLQQSRSRTTNWHPVSYPGVHAEAGPVPAEHLSGPVPAAAPQEGPHTAQVHRGRNVRALANKTLIPITKRDYCFGNRVHSHTHRSLIIHLLSAAVSTLTLLCSRWPCSDRDITTGPQQDTA